MFLGRNPGLLEVAKQGLVEPPRLHIAVGDLYRQVAVILHGLLLRHDAGPSLDDRHRCDDAIFTEQLRHAYLGSQQCLHHSLISMSTPAGRSIRMRESTVFGVGWWMSMSRL